MDDRLTPNIETEVPFPRLSRSNCIRRTKSRGYRWDSSSPESSRSQSSGNLAANFSTPDTREDQLANQHHGGEGFESSFESLDSFEDKQLDTAYPKRVEVPSQEESSLWSRQPEVITSGVLATLTKEQKYVQEAKYEILSSEVAYNRNLHILEDLFINAIQFADEVILSKNHREKMKAITNSSDSFLADIYAAWESSILLKDIFHVLLKHASHNFESYVKYCTMKMDMEKELKKMQKFYDQIKEEPAFCRQTLDSFFLSPMQRITRLPLMVNNIFTKLDKSDEEYVVCEKAHKALLKVANECNEDVRLRELMKTTLKLINHIEFPSSMKSVGLASESRLLVAKADFNLHWRISASYSASTKASLKKPITLILLSDLILICNRKHEQFSVDGYCKKNLTDISRTDKVVYIPEKYKTDRDGRFWLVLTFLSNHENRKQEMVLSCESDKKRSEWFEYFEPPISDVLGEIIYHKWDCPVFLAIKEYSSSKTDHLDLKVADKIHVLRKTTYGFFEGQRESDGQRGLFPKKCVTEIDSDHKKAGVIRRRMKRMSVTF